MAEDVPGFATIRYEVADGIATVTLNRPERLNAATGLMIRELVAALDAADADDAVRAVIVTGAGRAFCAGADLAAGAATFAGMSAKLRRADGSVDHASEAARDAAGILALRLYRSLKPIIGAINGAAVGIGATMTLPMDIRLAADDARFGFVFVRRGMVPEGAASFFLPRVVGISRALEWSLTGRLVPADEALAAGLVTAVHSPAALPDAARAIARSIAEAAAPVSVALTRQMLWRGLTLSEPMEAHRIESRGTLMRGASADAAEGVTAFLEKRPPAFRDRVSADLPDFFPWWEEPSFA